MIKLLKINEVSEITGLKISTLRAWILRRQIAYVKIGKRSVRISETELERLIHDGRVARRGNHDRDF